MIIIGFAYDLITELFTSSAGEGVGAGELRVKVRANMRERFGACGWRGGCWAFEISLCTGQVNHSGGFFVFSGWYVSDTRDEDECKPMVYNIKTRKIISGSLVNYWQFSQKNGIVVLPLVSFV